MSSICYLFGVADGPTIESLGGRIRRVRHMRGMSQATLGRPLSRAYISLLEHDRVVPSLRTLLAIAERLQVEPCDLLDAVGDKVNAEYTAGYGDDPGTIARAT